MENNKTIAGHITQKDILNEAEKLANTPNDGTCGLFAVQTANGWIESVKNKPVAGLALTDYDYPVMWGN